MKILIRMPNWLGDAVLALPALRAVVDNFSGSEIWVAVSSRSLELMATEPGVAGVLEVPEPLTMSDFWRLSRRWRDFKFDLAIIFTNSFSSALLASMAKIPERWGYKTDGRGFLLTKAVSRKAQPMEAMGKKGDEINYSDLSDDKHLLFKEKAEHQVLFYLKLLRGLNLQVPVEPKISINVTDEEREAARKLLSAHGLDPYNLQKEKKPLIVLNPGASYGPAKRWPASRFGQVATNLEKECGAASIIIGTANEEMLAREVVASSREKGISQEPINLSGQTTLRELMGILSWANLMITNDTGPMHLANALRVPVVALFGPTDPGVTRPWHEPYVVLHKKVICWPCWYRACPYEHSCMKLIDVADVLKACFSLLQCTEKKEDRKR